MRFYCDVDGFQQNWVDISERWTYGEQRRLFDSDNPADFWDMWRSKVKACYIERVSGVPIEDPAEIGEGALDDVDMVIVGFVGAVMVRAVGEMRHLGNASTRLSSSGKETQKAQAAA